MENAMGIATIFGPFLIIMGIWMLCYQANVKKVITSVKSTPGLMYVMGIINTLIGLTVLSNFNMWTPSLTFLVTLFGWVIFLRGLLVFFAPQMLFTKGVTSPGYLKIKGLVLVVWGFGLCWIALGM